MVQATLRCVLALLAAILIGSLARKSDSKGKVTTMVRMEQLGNCPELPNAANGFGQTEIIPWGRTYVARGPLFFNHNYTRFTKTVAHIRKCNDRADPNCEPFQNWRFGDESCTLLTARNMIWSPLFNFVPPLSCPIKAGRYMAENITVDLEKLKLIRFPEKGYYKISIMVDADNIPKILCFYFEATFIRVRL